MELSKTSFLPPPSAREAPVSRPADGASGPSALPGQGFFALVGDLEARARDMPQAEAFRFFGDNALRETGPERPEGIVWHWADLRDRVRGVARELAGVRPGDRVLLAYPTGLDFIAAFLGCLWRGVVAVPVSPPRPRERFSRWEHISRDARVAAILCAPSLRETMAAAGVAPVIVSAAADPAVPFAARPDDPPPARPGPADLAFLQYTSGSTSAPRGVMVSHAMLAANLEQIRLAFRFGPGDRIAGWLPHYHDMGLIGGILTPVHLGIPNAMMSPAAFLRDPIGYLELAGRIGATVLGGPNFSFDHALRHAGPEALARVDLSRLRFAFTGAEAIRPETLRRFHAAFAPRGFGWRHWTGCYGMAEATLAITVAVPGEGAEIAGLRDGAVVPEEDGLPLVADSGIPVPGVEVAIVAAGRALAEGRVGEIWVRGPNVAEGYWQNPEAGREVFGQVLAGEGGWLRTGDLGALRGGRLFVTGRIKELIIIRGRNLAPQDVEATAAAAHGDILPGRVAAFPLAEGGFGIVGELHRHACRAADQRPVLAALRAAVAEAHGAAPAVIALIRPASLPVTPSGKIQRFACRDALAAPGGDWLQPVALWREGGEAGSADVDAAAASALRDEIMAAPPALRRTLLTGRMQEMLARATAKERVPQDLRFFDAGLDSLGGVELVAALERGLGLPLDATLIYEYPTPAALALHLLGRLEGAPEAGVAPKPEPWPGPTASPPDPGSSPVRSPGQSPVQPPGPARQPDPEPDRLADEIRALEALLDNDPLTAPRSRR